MFDVNRMVESGAFPKNAIFKNDLCSDFWRSEKQFSAYLFPPIHTGSNAGAAARLLSTTDEQQPGVKTFLEAVQKIMGTWEFLEHDNYLALLLSVL